MEDIGHHRSIVVGEVEQKRADACDDIASGRNDHHGFQQRSFFLQIVRFSLKFVVARFLLNEN